MAIKVYKAITNGRRNMTSLDFAEITTNKPEKSLLAPLPKKAGRNNQGKITVRHHGGGHKKQYRIIDFKRNKRQRTSKKLLLSSTIQTVQRTSLYYTM